MTWWERKAGMGRWEHQRNCLHQRGRALAHPPMSSFQHVSRSSKDWIHGLEQRFLRLLQVYGRLSLGTWRRCGWKPQNWKLENDRTVVRLIEKWNALKVEPGKKIGMNSLKKLASENVVLWEKVSAGRHRWIRRDNSRFCRRYWKGPEVQPKLWPMSVALRKTWKTSHTKRAVHDPVSGRGKRNRLRSYPHWKYPWEGQQPEIVACIKTWTYSAGYVQLTGPICLHYIQLAHSNYTEPREWLLCKE